jgi:hypothetical protein
MSLDRTALQPTVTYMKCWGLRVSSLSAVTKVGAGQKGLRNHLTPNILYMMLAIVIYSIVNFSFFPSPASTIFRNVDISRSVLSFSILEM